MTSILFPEQPNFLIIQTDQQRFPMNWPKNWAMENLPAWKKLNESGLSFQNAFTVASACVPSRGAMHTSLYPGKTGLSRTFGPVGWNPKRPPMLQEHLKNFGVLKSFGYQVVYKGKWHLFMPVLSQDNSKKVGEWSSHDSTHLEKRYGYSGWNPPDAGNSESEPFTLGGGKINHDHRYLKGAIPGETTEGFGSSVYDFLKEQGKTSSQPFCLFVSLVNPHDICMFPHNYEGTGYELSDFMEDELFSSIGPPVTWQASLAEKPTAQQVYQKNFKAGGKVKSLGDAEVYARCYAYLQRKVDLQILDLLERVEQWGLRENTLIIRTADHGEMGLSHGMKGKMSNAYEQSIHIPLIFDHPSLTQHHQGGKATQKFASLLDLLPTLASLAGMEEKEVAQNFDGTNLTPYLYQALEKPLEEDVLHFTFNDGNQDETLANNICMVRTPRYKYAVYYDVYGKQFQFELYDLLEDPEEVQNLAYWGCLASLGEKEPEKWLERLELLENLEKKLREQMSRYCTQPLQFLWPSKMDYLKPW